MGGRTPDPGDEVRVHVETRELWRAWLGEHAGSAAAAWLVSWRAGLGRPAVPREAAAEEALCVGWVESRVRPVDDERTETRFGPRRRGSPWGRGNRERVERLERAGLMTEAGRRVVAEARRDGSWDAVAAADDLAVPDDLAAALEGQPGASAGWEAYPPSLRRGLLEWLLLTRRPATRERRVERIAEAAARGERPLG